MTYSEPEYTFTGLQWIDPLAHRLRRKLPRRSPYERFPSPWEIDQIMWSSPQSKGFKFAYFHEWEMVNSQGTDHSKNPIFTDIYGELGVDWDWVELPFGDAHKCTAIYTNDEHWYTLLRLQYEDMKDRWLYGYQRRPRPLYFAEYDFKDPDWVKLRQITSP